MRCNMMGLDSPLVRMMLSDAQANATNSGAVGSMGIGYGASRQSKSVGAAKNIVEKKRQKLLEYVAKKKKKDKDKSKRTTNEPVVQLPEPPDEKELGIATGI